MTALKWVDILSRLQTMDEIELQKPACYMDDEQFVTPITNFLSLTDDATISSDGENGLADIVELKQGDFCLGGDIW